MANKLLPCVQEELRRRGLQLPKRSSTEMRHAELKHAHVHSSLQEKEVLTLNDGNHQIIQDNIELVALMKACAKAKDLYKGMRVHAEIVKRGLFEKNIFIGNTLINMYAKCGAVARTQLLFDELPVPDIVSWTALIAGYCENMHAEEALHCFNQMQHEGLSPDAVTFACTLKACGSIGATEKGVEIHAEIVRKRFLGEDPMLGTALVDMYAKCGVMAKAQEVFDELPAHDIVSWTALIAGYCEHGHNKEAIDCFEKMKHEDISPDAGTLASILKACGSIEAAEKGKEIHAAIVKEELLGKDNVLGSALVDMYAKCDALGKARQVFNELLVRDRISWTALIAGYCENMHGQEALQCFEQMQHEGIPPDAVTFACVLKACSSVLADEKGRKVHADIVRNAFLRENTMLGNALVDMYAKCGILAKAKQVFHELPTHDLLSWNVLIAGYCDQGHAEEALSCFEQMKCDDSSPDGVTFACVLKACGTLRAAEKGKDIHTEIVRMGLLENNAVIGNALVDMYTKCGALAKAQQVFDGLPARDVVTWNTLIVGHFEHGHCEASLKCFERMEQEGPSPDVVTFACILKACGRARAADKGKELHVEIARKGLLGSDTRLESALLDMYGKCGALDKAQQVFDELQTPDVVSWTALITAYCDYGHGEEALQCFEKMQREDLSPDAVAFASILKACGCVGAAEKGKEIHAEIITKGFLDNHTVLGNALMDMYAKCGAFAKAQEVFDELQIRDVVSWNALVTGYARYGHGEEALTCFRQMQQECLYPDAVTFAGILKACSSIEVTEKGKEAHKVVRKWMLETILCSKMHLCQMWCSCKGITSVL